MNRSSRSLTFLLLISWSFAPAGAAAAAPDAVFQGPQNTPETVVRHLYDLVSFEAGTTPDWDEVRSQFLDEAVVVLRTAPTASTVFSVDGFVQDFVTFIQRANAEQTGFTERVIHVEPLVFRDIAHVLVLYEASIPGSQRPPQRGVDSFQLVKRDGFWKIAAVVNDIPNAEHPVPEVLRN
jgi:hypothetical protein